MHRRKSQMTIFWASLLFLLKIYTEKCHVAVWKAWRKINAKNLRQWQMFFIPRDTSKIIRNRSHSISVSSTYNLKFFCHRRSIYKKIERNKWEEWSVKRQRRILGHENNFLSSRNLLFGKMGGKFYSGILSYEEI